MEAVDLCCGDDWFAAPLALIGRYVFAIDIDEGVQALAGDRATAASARERDFSGRAAKERRTLAAGVLQGDFGL